MGRNIVGFGAGAAIGAVGGLIGLGGAEFRLPVLVGVLGYAVHVAVPVNLAVSFFTLLSAAATCVLTGAVAEAFPFGLEIAALIAGSCVAAYLAAGWLKSLSAERLTRAILWLLLAIGCLLIAEGIGGLSVESWFPGAPPVRAAVAAMLGGGVGIASSLLGVAGGELLIPIFVYVFGASIKAAGSASLLVSLPTVAVGLLRYRTALTANAADAKTTILVMGVGSVAGAAIGASLAPLVAAEALKLILGAILILSAWRTFKH